MKRIMVYSVVGVVTMLSVGSCCDDENVPSDNYTPDITAVEDGVTNYNGLLEAYPCIEGSSVYFGNYLPNNQLVPVPGYYNMINGQPTTEYNPVRLPIGTYNMVYWGYPSQEQQPQALYHSPAIIIGAPLSNSSFSLIVMSGDTTYHSVTDLVYGTQLAQIGTGKLSANLSRATSLLNVKVANQDGSSLNSAIDTMWVHIGSIAMNVNAYSAVATDFSKTVAVSMTAGSDSTSWTCSNIGLFPSAANPKLSLFIRLKNGTLSTFSQNLINTLSAGTNTNVYIYLNGTLTSESTTDVFTIANWTEQSENINVPIQ